MNRTNHLPRHGVSLIETILVIALLAAAAVTAAIFFDSDWTARRSATSVTNDVADSLVTARNTAITNQATVRVHRVRTSGTEQLVFTEESGPFRASKRWTVRLSENVRLGGSPNEIRFSPSGTANRAGLDDYSGEFVGRSECFSGQRANQSPSAMNRPGQPMHHPFKRHLIRRGATLIDVATGSMLLAVLLIPSIHLIGESQSMHRRLANHDTILFEAEKLVESTKVALSEPTAFDAVLARPVDVSGTIPISDGPDLKSRIQVAADVSLPGAKLLTIVADVWHDIDGDMAVGPNEPAESLRTQWASP